jgi:hypothetical protein
MISGNACCQIYFRMGGLWNTPVDLDDLDHVVAQLLRHPAIDIVAGRRRDGWIGVLSRRGCAAIRMRGDDIDYKALRGDPFGYPRMGASMDAQAAWQATVDTAYPDAIVQVAQLFRSARTGDRCSARRRVTTSGVSSCVATYRHMARYAPITCWFPSSAIGASRPTPYDPWIYTRLSCAR